MIFTKLELHRFGKFRETVAELKAGLVAQCLENEAGKSTMADFIYYMLYGFEKSRARRALEQNLLEKYQPWDSEEGLMGALELESGGKIYRIERSQDKKGKGVLRVLNEDGSETDITAPGEYFLGVDGETYSNIFYIRQGENTPTRTPQMDVLMKNLVTTGNEDISFDTVMERLLKEKQKYSSPKRGMGKIKKLEEAIVELRREIALGDADTASLSLSREIQQVEDDLAVCESSHKRLMTLEQTIHRHHAYLREQKRASLRQENDRLCQEMDALSVTDGAEERQWRAAYDERERTRARRQRATEAFGFLEQHPVSVEPRLRLAEKYEPILSPAPYKKGLFFGSLVLTAAVMAAAFFLPLLWIAAAVGVGGCVLLGTQLFGVPKALKKEGINSRGQLRTLIAQYEQAQAKADEYQTELQAATAEKDRCEQAAAQAEEQWHCVCEQTGIRSLEELAAAGQRQATRQVLSARIELNREKLAELEDTQAQDERIAEQCASPLPSLEQVHQDIRLLAQKKEALLSKKAQNAALSERQETAAKRLEEQKEELTLMEEELDKLIYAHDVVTIAIEQMQAAQEKLRENYAPLLRSALADKLSLLTDGKYDTVALDEQLSVRIKAEGGLRPLGYFSAGTRDAVYLALRLSLAELMEQGDKLPLIFDDPFLSLDDKRWKILRSYLEKMGQSRQILFFSCREI